MLLRYREPMHAESLRLEAAPSKLERVRVLDA